MKYVLIFDTPKGDKVYEAEGVTDEALDKAVRLKNDAPKRFLINKEKTRGRMYYGLMRYWEFEIKKIRGK